MSSQSLYRKWRSRSFDEILGQEHVVRTLRNAIQHDRIAQAYLFTGPRGTGKTSTARVLAKAVNCQSPRDGLPCGECPMCVSIASNRSQDVVEIDGASNNGIDDVRALRENAAYAPTEGRFKVYIIDEVHRLSGSAFDGLLKTLEEPPPHVLFIFASTEPHKVPVTILSRCQRFDFHRIDRETTIGRVRHVAAAEGISIDDEATVLISQQAGGSLRDALGILDQVRSFAGNEISSDDVRSATGLGQPELIAGISELMISANAGPALGLVHEAVSRGLDPRTLLRQLIEYWRGLLLYTVGNPESADLDPLLAEAAAKQATKLNSGKVVDVLRALTEEVVEPKLSVSPELPLEIAVIQSILGLQQNGPKNEDPAGVAQATDSGSGPRRSFRETSEQTGGKSAAEMASRAHTTADRTFEVDRAANEGGIDFNDAISASVHSPEAPAAAAALSASEGGMSAQLKESWPLIIEAMRDRRRLQGLLRDVQTIAVVESEVTLGFRNSFHREQSDKPENRLATEKVIEELVGARLKVRCVRADSNATPALVDEADTFVADAERMLRGIHAQQLRTTKFDG